MEMKRRKMLRMKYMQDNLVKAAVILTRDWCSEGSLVITHHGFSGENAVG